MGKVIAIDGPTGAGKSTVAKLIARQLGFSYLDTGALYRAIAFALRKSGVNSGDSDERLMDVLCRTVISYTDGKVFLHGKDISDNVRSKEIDHYSSVFSKRKIVRDFLFDIQRNAGSACDIVVEGRDTATIVFPKAWKKFYLDASLEERAKRRYLQYKDRGIHFSIEECIKDVITRDKRDSNRDIAPLKKADDSFVVDSSNLSIEEVQKKMIEHIRAGP